MGRKPKTYRYTRKERGRPPTYKDLGKMERVDIRLPVTILQKIKEKAKLENKKFSEIIRDTIIKNYMLGFLAIIGGVLLSFSKKDILIPLIPASIIPPPGYEGPSFISLSSLLILSGLIIVSIYILPKFLRFKRKK